MIQVRPLILLLVILIFSACKNEQAGKDKTDKNQAAKVESNKTPTLKDT